MKIRNRLFRRFLRVLIIMAILALALGVFYYYSVRVIPPEVSNKSILEKKREKLRDYFFQLEDNWLVKNPEGLWEIYLDGEAFERGVTYGKLCEDLLGDHEKAFIEGMKEKVPSETYLNILKYFVAWFNRDLPDYIPLEFQKEIYGSSIFKSADYDFIGPRYHRALNYHAAHDVGHALQNMGLVGCTTLSDWGNDNQDSSLIIGRNFDFYVGDEFARHKMISFINPTKGHPFASISWPGMSGVVSGMNREGLVVTLNAAPSNIPKGAKTPVAILARKMVQYAKNIEEAFLIADTTQTFVSENFIISSAFDNKTVVIEKTPEKTILFETQDNHLVCSNHFQSGALKDNETNLKSKKNSSTSYRFDRMTELFNQHAPLTQNGIVEILRDPAGLKDAPLGLGNEMAINIQIAHHSVFFKPHERKLWVAATPSQLGAYICYDLDRIFNDPKPPLQTGTVASTENNIPADSFLRSEYYASFQEFRVLTETIEETISQKERLPESTLNLYAALNPNHYLTYLTLGKYYQSIGNCIKALEFFNKGLKMPIPWADEKKAFKEGLADCKN